MRDPVCGERSMSFPVYIREFTGLHFFRRDVDIDRMQVRAKGLGEFMHSLRSMRVFLL